MLTVYNAAAAAAAAADDDDSNYACQEVFNTEGMSVMFVDGCK